jgi:hypothetical protein
MTIVTEVPARLFAIHVDSKHIMWLFGIDPLGHYWVASSFHNGKWLMVPQGTIRTLHLSLADGWFCNDNQEWLHGA